MAVMPNYKIYAVSKDGCVKGVPWAIDCRDDREAIERAKVVQNDSDIEVWEGKRRVAVLKSNPLPRR